MVPLATGLILTFGFSYLVYGRLSAATSGVAALLIGLGIDFIIVSYGRFVEERQQRQEPRRRAGAHERFVRPGGGDRWLITSAATFYAFGVTDFTGLREMGFLTGTGILFCMVAVLFLLPALLTWSDHRHSRRARRRRGCFCTASAVPGSFASACTIPGRCCSPSAGVTPWCWDTWRLGVRFEDSVRSMRPEGSPAVEFREEVARRFGSGFESMMLLIRGETPEEVLAHRSMPRRRRARELVDEGVLTGVDSVAAVVPPAGCASGGDSTGSRTPVRNVLTRAACAPGSSWRQSTPGCGWSRSSQGLDLFEEAVSIAAPIR